MAKFRTPQIADDLVQQLVAARYAPHSPKTSAVLDAMYGGSQDQPDEDERLIQELIGLAVQDSMQARREKRNLSAGLLLERARGQRERADEAARGDRDERKLAAQFGMARGMAQQQREEARNEQALAAGRPTGAVAARDRPGVTAAANQSLQREAQERYGPEIRKLVLAQHEGFDMLKLSNAVQKIKGKVDQDYGWADDGTRNAVRTLLDKEFEKVTQLPEAPKPRVRGDVRIHEVSKTDPLDRWMESATYPRFPGTAENTRYDWFTEKEAAAKNAEIAHRLYGTPDPIRGFVGLNP